MQGSQKRNVDQLHFLQDILLIFEFQSFSQDYFICIVDGQPCHLTSPTYDEFYIIDKTKAHTKLNSSLFELIILSSCSKIVEKMTTKKGEK